jgi:hypothetical protein
MDQSNPLYKKVVLGRSLIEFRSTTVVHTLQHIIEIGTLLQLHTRYYRPATNRKVDIEDFGQPDASALTTGK